LSFFNLVLIASNSNSIEGGVTGQGNKVMEKEENNYAYIDAANLYKGIGELGWKLDYTRFRLWLSEKYGVSRAYIFIGLVPKNKELYKYLQEAGFTLIFKETTYDINGKPKGNCDAEIVLQAARDTYENKFDKAI